MVALARRAGVRIISVAGVLSLAEAVAHMEIACFVISVDTVIAHLAAAAGAPVVCLHGPTTPERWGTRGRRSVAITPDAPPGVPVSYINHGFEFPKGAAPCMPFISVAQVMQALRKAGLLRAPDAPTLEIPARPAQLSC